MEIEKSYILKGIVPSRYIRNINAISQEEQLQLYDARIGICGCGGLGMNITSYLARMGVGHITIWDPDVISESNLNRQLFANYSNLGQSKVNVCQQLIRKINPLVCITGLQSRWEDADKSLLKQKQILVDALDNVPSRLALAKVCEQNDIPMVHGAIGGWYGQLTVVMPGDHSLYSLYGSSIHEGIEKEQGTLPFTAAIVAGLQAAEVIKLLLKKDSVLIEEICIIDTLDLSIEHLKKCNGSVFFV